MSEELSKTLQHGDFDSVFKEVVQPEIIDWTTKGELRLFCLDIRNNAIRTEELKKYIYMSIGDYVFSRAVIERFTQSGNRDAVVAQAQRVLKKNGGADVQGSGGELGEFLNYVFMEERLKAPKLMSRAEIDTDGKKYRSASDSIHVLTKSTSGRAYHQVVFGASSIVGDPGYAIDAAFEKIGNIDENENGEIHMVSQMALERMATEEEVDLVKDILIPKPDKKTSFNTSYGIFIGYSLGLGDGHPVEEFIELAEKKIRADAKRYIPYILEKIRQKNLTAHSFYFYFLPFNDAEAEKKTIMEAVLEGDVDLV